MIFQSSFFGFPRTGGRAAGHRGARPDAARSCFLLVFLFGWAAAKAIGAGGEETETLPPFVVSAARLPPESAGGGVQVVAREELDRREARTLRDALAAAGAPAVAGGGEGALASLFLRGANSDHTLFLVDGVRMNDANTPSQNLLAGLATANLDRVEILRGPQGMLYGGEALGGVVSLVSRKGRAGPAAGSVLLEAGSLGTASAAVSGEGGAETWVYSFGGGIDRTDNERPNNAFSRAHYALRADWALSDSAAAGATLRGSAARYRSPGSRFFPDADDREREQNHLATWFLEHRPAQNWESRVVTGGQWRRLVAEDPGEAVRTVARNDRVLVDWQNIVRAGRAHRLLAGVTAERSYARNSGFGNINQTQRAWGFFLQDEWRAAERLRLTGGVRSDDHSTFGRQPTYRLAAEWSPLPERWNVRASYGTAFRSPSFLDLYGVSPFFAGNPGLGPERSAGWDVGAAYRWDGLSAEASLTFFGNEFRDLIVYDFGVFPGTTANVARARTGGLEAAAGLRLGRRADLRVDYTYLDAVDRAEGARLLRRPRHNAGLALAVAWDARLSFGVEGRLSADREDVHAATFQRIAGEDYLAWRLFSRYRASENVFLRLRVENAGNSRYEEAHGFPVPGRRILAGVECLY